MKLEDESGSSLALRIVGYQFPNAHDVEYDSNWLLIEIAVVSPARSWKSTDPCLLTYEVKRLAEWLDQIYRSENTFSRIVFLEPNLSFQLLGDHPGTRTLRVYFELECRPPWAQSSSVGEEDQWIDLDIAAIDLPAAANDLRTQLERYPQRTSV